jgi:hypothetical protein
MAKPLEQMSKDELIARAEQLRLGITYIGQRSKPELMRLIREAEGQRQSA